MIREELKLFITGLESDIKPIDEFSVGEKIAVLLKTKEEQISDKGELAEYMAMEFLPDYRNQDTGWSTYYGPKFVLPNPSGQFVEFPSIKRVDQEILSYWKDRANKTTHPSLACRYADLVVDFSAKINNQPIDYKMVQKVIDSTIEVCNKNLDDELGCKTKLKRALSLAIQINDSDRTSRIVETIIKTEEKFAQDDKPGLWGYAFRWLLVENSGKVSLTKDQEDYLVSSLESRLSRLRAGDNPDPWGVECAIKPLAKYYASKQEVKNLERVLSNFEEAFRKNKRANSDGMLISNYLEQLIEMYLEYSAFKFAKDARDRVVNELSSLGDRAKMVMKEIKTEVKIKNEDIEKFIKSIFGESTSDGLEKVIAKLAVNFVLRKKSVETQLDKLSREHPVSYLFSHVQSSEDGYPIVKYGSISDNYDMHLLENFSRNLHFQAFFLRIAFEELRKRYTPEELCKLLISSPVFRSEDEAYILKLLTSFWNKEGLVFSCLAVPLIEDAVRNLHRINNATFIRPNEQGGYDVLSLDKLLGAGLIKRVFSTLGEDIEYYFKALLTERAGWNLRNNFAHGINKGMFVSEDVNGRLLHVLLCLSLVRKR